ncbi:hypothetical protein Plhal304r1_c012g0046491 [Plasmopara halstedii]
MGDEKDATIDTTTWPINRLSFVELSVQDRSTIERLFHSRSDTPLLMKWVMLHKSGSKFRPRIFVVSALRLWVLKHKKTIRQKLILCRQFQLMRVQKLFALRTDPSSSSHNRASTVSLQLFFSPKHAKEKNQASVKLYFDPGVHAEHFVRLLQRQFFELRLTFSQHQMPLVKLPPDYHWYDSAPNESLLESHTKQKTDGVAIKKPDFAAMAMAYRAYCDDLGIQYRDSISARLKECATTSGCIDFQYCLGFPAGVSTFDHLSNNVVTPLHAFASSVASKYFPGLRPNYLSKEIQALARTLKHAMCFSDVIICDLAMGQASLAILFKALLSPVCTITGFTFTNVQLSIRALRILRQVVLESMTQQTGNTMRNLQLQRLDLSFNHFTANMAIELSTILQLLPNGLETLHLERCDLMTNSCCRIIGALTTSSAFSVSLLELNIASNHLGLEGTKALASWITRISSLQRLDVSRTHLDINLFVQALKQNTLLHKSSLLQLDLSYNHMRTQASEDLGAILGQSQSLATIFLRGMKRYRHFHKLLPMQLQREGTLLALSNAAVAAQTAATGRNRGTIHRADGLRKQYLSNILAPMFENTDRSWSCMVDLSENDLSGGRAEVLAQLLDDSSWSARVSLRLDHTRLHDKSALLLLHSIRGCKTLESLSLEGNGFVDRQSHRKRQRRTEKCYRDGVMPSEPNIMEKAGANALTLLLGGTLDCDNNQLESWLGTKDTESAFAAFSVYSSSLKPLRLKELCLKSEGPFIFGTHIITAAIQALDKPHAYLQMLDVSGNECGNALAEVLRDVLPKNKSLQTLFWDENNITVDGYCQFYDGLLRNHTLVMVQMPIQDTRRILEEQKNPPREKLFSILGKIFEITERNQIWQRKTDELKAEARFPGQCLKIEPNTLVHPIPGQTLKLSNNCSEAATTRTESFIHQEIKLELESTGLKLQQCPSPRLAEVESEKTQSFDNHTRKSYSRSKGARYPSTMQSWSMQSSTEDFRTQLKKLDSLTASTSMSSSNI